MPRTALDPNAREHVLGILGSVTARIRAMITEHAVEGSALRRVTIVFSAIAAVRERIENTPGDLPPRLVPSLEQLMTVCNGPTGRFRHMLQEAIAAAQGAVVKPFGVRCPVCGTGRRRESESCERCGH